MGLAVLVLFYGGAVFCVVALLTQLVRYVTVPIHLHWELYYGSSVYELSDWHTKPHRTVWDKLKEIVIDVLVLRKYFQRNRKFWYFLILFHGGLYLLILWHVWLFADAAVRDASPYWGLVWGHVSTGLIFIGAVGIFAMRLADYGVRVYYPPIHYVKWSFIILTLAGGFYAVFYYFGGNIAEVLKYVQHQLEFELASKLDAPAETSVHLLFVVPWLIYIPFSHIMKLFFRYYHELRWDDKPNLADTDVEREVIKQLNRRLTWSAPHMMGGKKWAEAAVKMPESAASTGRKK